MITIGNFETSKPMGNNMSLLNYNNGCSMCYTTLCMLTWPNGESKLHNNYLQRGHEPQPLWRLYRLDDVRQQKQVCIFRALDQNLVVFVVISKIMYDRASQVSAKTWSSLNFGSGTPNTTTQDTHQTPFKTFVHCLCPLLRNSLSKPTSFLLLQSAMSYDRPPKIKLMCT